MAFVLFPMVIGLGLTRLWYGLCKASVAVVSLLRKGGVADDRAVNMAGQR